MPINYDWLRQMFGPDSTYDFYQRGMIAPVQNAGRAAIEPGSWIDRYETGVGDRMSGPFRRNLGPGSGFDANAGQMTGDARIILENLMRKAIEAANRNRSATTGPGGIPGGGPLGFPMPTTTGGLSNIWRYLEQKRKANLSRLPSGGGRDSIGNFLGSPGKTWRALTGRASSEDEAILQQVYPKAFPQTTDMAELEAAAGIGMAGAPMQGPPVQGAGAPGLAMDPRMEALLNPQGGGMAGGGVAFKPMEFDVEKYKQALTVPQSPEQLALRQRIMDMLSQPQPEMPNVQLPEPERERGWSDMSGGQKFASVLSGLAQMAGTGLTAYADPEIAARQTAQRREMEARRKERAEALLYQRAPADRDYGMQRWQAANQMQGNQINRMGTLYDMFSGDQRDTREMNRDIINRGMDVDMYNAQGQNRATERAEGRSYDAARDARNRAFDLLEGRQRGDIDMQNAVKGSLGASAMSAWGQYRKAVVAARDAKGTPQYESLLKQAALLKQEWDEQAAMAERAGIRLGF